MVLGFTCELVCLRTILGKGTHQAAFVIGIFQAIEKHVVDDLAMGITHVIRAEEWLSSLPKHVQLYRAFAWELPVFCHLPLLRNADKSKISGRYCSTRSAKTLT